MSAKKRIDEQLEHNIGESLLKRFRAEETKDIDLGFGDVIKLRIPKTFSEYSNMMAAARDMYVESGQTDENWVYVYLLQSVVTNLPSGVIEQIVFEAPGLSDLLLKTLDNSCGNVMTRLESELLEESKKKSEKTSLGETS